MQNGMLDSEKAREAEMSVSKVYIKYATFGRQYMEFQIFFTITKICHMHIIIATSECREYHVFTYLHGIDYFMPLMMALTPAEQQPQC